MIFENHVAVPRGGECLRHHPVLLSRLLPHPHHPPAQKQQHHHRALTRQQRDDVVRIRVVNLNKFCKQRSQGLYLAASISIAS